MSQTLKEYRTLHMRDMKRTHDPITVGEVACWLALVGVLVLVCIPLWISQ